MKKMKELQDDCCDDDCLLRNKHFTDLLFRMSASKIAQEQNGKSRDLIVSVSSCL